MVTMPRNSWRSQFRPMYGAEKELRRTKTRVIQVSTTAKLSGTMDKNPMAGHGTPALARADCLYEKVFEMRGTAARHKEWQVSTLEVQAQRSHANVEGQWETASPA
jgi:hypothetical protein